ncbi:Tn3 family transposase [Actinoplanes derwentensis]|uniref:Tn3 family transposase n=1 Tax=Actinoplanes derwentensis TaxID=113562 RepID=UPI000B8544F4
MISSLVVNCVALWNTVYLDRILATLRESGYPVLDEDVLRVHPYWYAHLNCTATTRSNRCSWPKVSGDDRCGTQATPTPTRSERG